ncbi:MAG: hypothetical protein ACE5GX_13845 [Thermoanaerobaculia bacterium]
MIGLPHGLAEPLHIDEPFPTWKLVVAALVAWLLYRLARWFLARLSAARAAVPRLPPPRIPASGIVGLIGEIRRRYHGDYRRGCHELAAALRRHFGQESGTRSSVRRHPFPKLTVGEIRARIGDTAISRLFGLLAELQFFRREPTKSDFEGACDLAIDVAQHATAAPGAANPEVR